MAASASVSAPTPPKRGALCRCYHNPVSRFARWVLRKMAGFCARLGLLALAVTWVLVRFEAVHGLREALSRPSSTASVQHAPRSQQSDVLPHVEENVTFTQAFDATLVAVELWLALLSPSLRAYVLASLEFIEPAAIFLDDQVGATSAWIVSHPPAGKILALTGTFLASVYALILIARTPCVAERMCRIRVMVVATATRVKASLQVVVDFIGTFTLHVAYWAIGLYFAVPSSPMPASGSVESLAVQGVNAALQLTATTIFPLILSIWAMEYAHTRRDLRWLRLVASFWIVRFTWIAFARVNAVGYIISVSLPRLMCPLLSLMGQSELCGSSESTDIATAYFQSRVVVVFSFWLLVPVLEGSNLLVLPIASLVNRHLVSVRALTSNAQDQATGWLWPLQKMVAFYDRLQGREQGVVSGESSDTLEKPRRFDIVAAVQVLLRIAQEGVVLLGLSIAFLLVSPDIGYWFLCWVYCPIQTLEIVLSQCRSVQARQVSSPLVETQEIVSSSQVMPEIDSSIQGPLAKRVQMLIVLVAVDVCFRTVNTVGVLWIPFMSTLQFLTVVALQLPVLNIAHRAYSVCRRIVAATFSSTVQWSSTTATPEEIQAEALSRTDCPVARERGTAVKGRGDVALASIEGGEHNDDVRRDVSGTDVAASQPKRADNLQSREPALGQTDDSAAQGGSADEDEVRT
eukprot:INCI15818.2.p1 GENE.INCI15818.2~~INCI15818.2.p1  ORF type:complete len:688 (+),score=87.15 INCI15818.2:79-2142(+)